LKQWLILGLEQRAGTIQEESGAPSTTRKSGSTPKIKTPITTTFIIGGMPMEANERALSGQG
jgi:hypothetical protein